MDIRIEKTDRAIEKAFMELRARQPLEKIRIKDLCTLAKVNKSTFYAPAAIVPVARTNLMSVSGSVST